MISDCGLRNKFVGFWSVVLNIQTLFYGCGLWFMYCGVHNADCGERYTLWMSACLLLIVEFRFCTSEWYLWILKISINDRNLIFGLWIVICPYFISICYMNLLWMTRSHTSGTGPSKRWTGPKKLNFMGPVPKKSILWDWSQKLKY